MKCNCFEANKVVSGRDGGGNSSCPRAVLGDHLSRSPLSVINSTGKKTGFIDFELKKYKASERIDIQPTCKIIHTQDRDLASTPVQDDPGHCARYVSIGPVLCGQTAPRNL